jgi:hypothetical protein
MHNISSLCKRHRVYLQKPWNLALSSHPYGRKSFQASVSRIESFNPYWRIALERNFPPQSAYLEFPKILTTVRYAVDRWPKCHYVAHDYIDLIGPFLDLANAVICCIFFSLNVPYINCKKIIDCSSDPMLYTEKKTADDELSKSASSPAHHTFHRNVMHLFPPNICILACWSLNKPNIIFVHSFAPWKGLSLPWSTSGPTYCENVKNSS